MKLSSKLKGCLVKVISIDFQDQYILHKLNNIGICKNNIIRVLNYNKTKDVLHLEIFDVEYVLREKDCHFVEVEIIKEKK